MYEGDAVATPDGEGVPPATGRTTGDVQDSGIQSLVSSFLANITNEFRTPLAALNACVEYLLNDLEMLSADEVRELLQSVHLSVTGLHTLIDNLIESSNIEAGRFALKTTAVDIGTVASEAIRFVRPLVNRRRQRIVVERQGSLPLVDGDPSRLAQVMVNLLSSASRFGPMNQTICVGLGVHELNQLRVTIVDRDLGFPLEEHGRPFDRAIKDTVSTDLPYGVELGISVATAIIEAHGGKVGVRQFPGDGSVFWFTIPAARRLKGV